MSTKPSTIWLLISTSRCKVLLLWFLFTLIFHIARTFELLIVTFIDLYSSFFHLLANLTNLSKYFNSLQVWLG
jgi:hypothetical protein